MSFMKLDPILTKAVRFAKKKNYDETIKILESEHNRYYGKFTYYYLLGLAYLHSNIFGVALRYLNLAVQQKLRDVNTLLALAALNLNHGDTDKAVDLYLEVQSIDGNNRIARKALEIVRKHPGPENISAWIDSGKIHKIFPPFPNVGISPKGLAVTLISLFAGLCLFIGFALKTELISLPLREGREVPQDALLAGEERESPVQVGGVYRYVLTADQVLSEYNMARRLFAEYRDDAARVRLNHILESNASEPVKNRARILISYLQTPGFDTLRDRFTYAEVEQNPFLYRDCHVIWRGMISNLMVGQTSTTFDLLVGYDTRRILEGMVQVVYDFAIPVNPERPVEILGRVIPVGAAGTVDGGAGIRIQGIALNQAGLLEQSP